MKEKEILKIIDEYFERKLKLNRDTYRDANKVYKDKYNIELHYGLTKLLVEVFRDELKKEFQKAHKEVIKE